MAHISSKRTLVIAAAVAATALSLHAATTGWNQTAAGTYSYSDPANWVGGAINNVWDSSLTLAGAQTITFNADTTMSAASFLYAAKYNLTLRSDGTADRVLTLAGDITNNTNALDVYIYIGSGTANQKLSLNLGGATRTFDVVGAGNRYVEIRNDIAGTNATDGVTKVGAGTLYYNNGINSTYTGQTNVNGGTLWMSSTSRATGSDFSLNGGTLRFDSSGSGYTSMARTKSLTSYGGTLQGTASTSTSQNTNDLMGALTLSRGASTVTLTPTAGRHMRMTADSLTRQAGSAVLFRGTNLGVNDLSANTVGAASFVVTAAPALTGTGTAGTASAPFLKGAFADTAAAGVGNAALTGGLATYDAQKGVRLLNTATEYQTYSADGAIASSNDNVRIVGAAGANRTMTADGAPNTEVGSLTLVAGDTANGSGITITGNTLRVNTGVIQAGGTITGATATTTDAFNINVSTLDLNGTEGILRAITPVTTTGTFGTAGRLNINSVITNDGGNGLTISSGGTNGSGSGVVALGGTTANTFTGPTNVDNAILILNKPQSVNAIGGDLVLNSGYVYLTNNHQIPDTADVTINGGTFYFATSNNSGSGRNETFTDLVLTGGSTSAAGANQQTVNITGSASVSGGVFNGINGGKVTVTGPTTLNGGRFNVGTSTATNQLTSVTTFSGGLAISNTASGAYSPITMSSHGSNLGGRMVLGGDVLFTGNSTNANPTKIAMSDASLLNQGRIELTAVRTFNIGDGAAAEDLAIYPVIMDGTTAGGITKIGKGTLALYGNTSYTGGTSVSDGTLLINGTTQGAVSITGTGVLGGSGTISGTTTIAADGTLSPGNSPGVLTITGDLSLADGAKFVFDLGADEASSDRVNVSGILALAGQDWSDFTFNVPATGLQNSYVLFHSGGITGSLGSAVTGNLGGSTYSLSVVGNDVVLAVPEPSLLATGASVASLLIMRRRRRVA